MRVEGDDRWGPPISLARRGAKAAQGGGCLPMEKVETGQGRHRLTGLLGRRREAAAREVVGQCGRSRPAGPKSTESFKTDLIFEFQWISNFSKTLKICTRRFRRNLDMRIVSKIF
jgi:hypothetical protein